MRGIALFFVSLINQNGSRDVVCGGGRRTTQSSERKIIEFFADEAGRESFDTSATNVIDCGDRQANEVVLSPLFHASTLNHQPRDLRPWRKQLRFAVN